MVATWKEPLETVIDILAANYDSGTDKGWNRANTDNVKPVIVDIANETPERVSIYKGTITSYAMRQPRTKKCLI